MGRAESGGTGRSYRVVKRSIDICVGSALLGLALPVMGLIAGCIVMTSRGGPFFVQPRVGENGRWFKIIKFRTMVSGAVAAQAELENQNELDGAVFAMRHDPRVTRVGQFLRRTSLDELPQLFNVVAGEMSLVGPRPLPERDYAMLNTQHKIRCRVKPGMTGLAQITGRNDLSFDQMMACDASYVQDCSLRLDLEILAGTPKAVVSGAGAY